MPPLFSACGFSDSLLWPTLGRVDRPTLGRVDRPTLGRVDRPTLGRVDKPTLGRVHRPTLGRVVFATTKVRNLATGGRTLFRLRRYEIRLTRMGQSRFD